MRVSVIIPVYNAERFLVAAVESALAQPETGEVLLIEDGSQDSSLGLCRQMQTDARVRLLTHPGNANLGAAAARNLGIKNASMEYIAFLDADDTYAPGRFKNTNAVLKKYPDADGVHETIGVFYHEPLLQEQHLRRVASESTGVRIPAPPEDLFHILATGKYGHIHLDGLVIQRSSLAQGELMATDLVMSEDSDFILRLAAHKKLYGGDPSHIVALRGVHAENSVFRNPHVAHFRVRYLQKCIDHNFYGSGDLMACLYILTRRIGASTVYGPFRGLGKVALPVKLIFIAVYLVWHPKVILNLVRRI